MVVKKFYAQNTRDALRQVREDLGADALILSNRPTLGGGVEIMAVADSEFTSIATNLSGSQQTKNPARHNSHTLTAGSNPTTRALERAYQQPSHLDTIKKEKTFKDHILSEHKKHTETHENIHSPSNINHEDLQSSYREMMDAIQSMGKEISHLRKTIDEQKVMGIQELSSFNQNISHYQSNYLHEIEQLKEYIREQNEQYQRELSVHHMNQSQTGMLQNNEVINALIPAGFSLVLLNKIMQKLPHQYTGSLALKWVKSALIHNLKCPLYKDDPILQGGIFAIVGTTGSGKTSTAVKLASRALQKLGSDKVALISIDLQKIASNEQMKIYGTLLGIKTYSVQNTEELKKTLDVLLETHKTIIIDTPGMSQKDGRVIHQSKVLSSMGYDIKQILILPATNSGDILEEIIRQFYTKNINATILSKMDETTNIGSVLDVAIRHRLPLWYMTNGQRIPKDIHLASSSFLVDRAMRHIDYTSAFNPLNIFRLEEKKEHLVTTHEQILS
jgi:flagellar biosynthesis protein FlhF